jgi:PBP4 family serine-type D-alanyl-D-alanine carboxypeptidase
MLRRLVVSSLCASALAAQPALDKRIQAVMDRPEFAHAIWGMEFYDLKSKQTIFAINRDRLFVPGSTTKTVTMGTALETLGPDHRFRTKVYRTGPVRGGVVEGDLVLVASGDPNLSGRDQPDGSYAFIDQDHSYGGRPLPSDPLTVLRDLTKQIAAKGIRGVTGQVIVDASLFPEEGRELGTRIALSPFVLNDNVIDIVVTPGAKTGDAATVSISPRTAHLTVIAQAVTVDSGAPSGVRSVEDSTDKDHRTLQVTARVQRGLPPVNARWAVPAPSRFGEIVFSEVLQQAGITAIPRLAGRKADFVAMSKSYADSLVVAERVSLPLTAEARVLLKTSQNLHASNFPLLLGALPPAREARKDGFDVARDWLVREGIDVNGAVQSDGAGGDAFFSPAFMTRYLAMVATKPWAKAFYDALPILGKDGTLALIQVNAPAVGQVHAKTGTFSTGDRLNDRLIVHGKGLAGYFTSKSGKEVAFAIYLNNFAGPMPDPAGFAGQALGEIASIAWEVIR